MEKYKLTVHHYSENPEEERRVTLSPGQISFVAIGVEDITVGSRSLRSVTVMFMDGGSVDLVVNHSDMEMLESAVGTYYLQ